MDLTTPALLFPAISLLLLAYTNRYLTLAGLIRDLHEQRRITGKRSLHGQIASLRKRIHIIRAMQILGVSSFFASVATMLLIFFGLQLFGEIVFGLSLALLLSSLGCSIWELTLSVDALEMQLDDCEPVHAEAARTGSSSNRGCVDGEEG